MTLNEHGRSSSAGDTNYTLVAFANRTKRWFPAAAPAR